MRYVLVALLGIFVVFAPAAAQTPSAAPVKIASGNFDDNSGSIAVVVGNRDYKQAVSVDFALNDADAMKSYLTQSLGFRDENVFVLKDATLSELNQMFGTESNPQSGRLWRSVTAGKSNVFVYYSGHGVPDLGTRQPFLLPQDGNPNQSDSGYALETLYRNLDLVKQKIGPDRQLIVMIDACFTGETGRKGESLLAVSAPGFTPAKPKTSGDLIRLVATSGDTPANWDQSDKLGLFTSRFLMGVAGLLMGVAGLAKPAGAPADGAITWVDLQDYLKSSVAAAALRDTGRKQIPEIDPATIALKANKPVSAVAHAVALAKDEANWSAASSAGTRIAIENYIGQCGDTCLYRDKAMAMLMQQEHSTEGAADEQRWQELSPQGKYQDYLNGCTSVCAYRSIAENYLGKTDVAHDAKVKSCDELASDPKDPDKASGVKGVRLAKIDSYAAIEACTAAATAHPDLRRLAYQLGRAYDKAQRNREAVAAYTKASDAGSISAMNNLGAMYKEGSGTAPSMPQALALFQRSAQGGDVMAMGNLGAMYQYGQGTPKNEAEAIRWYQKGADAGDMFSITKLVPYYVSGGPGIPKDLHKGLALYKKAIAGGDPLAMATVATLIDNGFGADFAPLRSADMVLGALRKGDMGAAAVAATDTGSLKLRPDTIRAVQSTVAKAGYYAGQIDGRFNPVFVRALGLYAQAMEQQN